MLQTPIDVTVARDTAIGPGIAESPQRIGSPPTEAAACIIQAAPHLLEPEEEGVKKVQSTESCVTKFIDDLVEVNERCEFDSTIPDISLLVKGNLRRNIQFWRKIGSPEFILSVVQEGYCLELNSIPEKKMFKNNKSALKHSPFVEEAIHELLRTHRVVELAHGIQVINPLSVSVQANGKKRLILDLRYVNEHLKKQKVKYEDWKIALSYFQKGAFMISFDLKSGYHHIDIHPEYQKFLGFAWKFSNEGSYRYFVFTVLPFGLSSAPYIFTKMLKPLEKFWRFQGIQIALFLDDGWLTEKEESACRLLAQTIRSDLRQAGFITNDEKSVWQPKQSLQWLGIVWDTVQGTIAISERRVSSILEKIEWMTGQEFVVSARELASFVGKIISASSVFGNVSRIMTRYCSIAIASSQDWDTKFKLDDYCRRELKFWEKNLTSVNLRSIVKEPMKKSHFIVYSDASGTGCGATLELNGEQLCHKQWLPEEKQKSSTWRELSAIEFGLQSFLPLLQGSFVKWFSDSQTACKIVQIGSMKRELHEIAIAIFEWCARHEIHLEIQWIPRTELERADYVSRLIDIDDWQLTLNCFEWLESVWGVHTVDCFANHYNKKVGKYFSRFWNPGCSGVDFFVQNLQGENCLVVPPVDLIGRAIHYLYACQACATVVVPFWPSSYFWPILSRNCARFIEGSKVFSGRYALTHGRNTNTLLGSDRFHGDMLAVRMRFDGVEKGED